MKTEGGFLLRAELSVLLGLSWTLLSLRLRAHDIWPIISAFPSNYCRNIPYTLRTAYYSLIILGTITAGLAPLYMYLCMSDKTNVIVFFYEWKGRVKCWHCKLISSSIIIMDATQEVQLKLLHVQYIVDFTILKENNILTYWRMGVWGTPLQ